MKGTITLATHSRINAVAAGVLTTLLVLTSAQVRGQEKPKLAELAVGDGVLNVSGIWRPDNPTKHNELMEAVTDLSCFRHGGKELVGTEAFCLQATATVIEPDEMLDVSTAWLKVVEWSETQVVATDDSSICVTSRTIFDLKRKTVIALDVRKSEAQGLGGACNLSADRQTYYLQDKVDYYVKKNLAATANGTHRKP
jgi:hypothetical protein